MSAALDLTINDSILWGNNRFVVNAIDSEQVIITNMTTKQIRGVPLHTVQSSLKDGSIQQISTFTSAPYPTLTRSEQADADLLETIGKTLNEMDKPFGLTGKADNSEKYYGQLATRKILDEHGLHSEKTYSKAKLGRIRKFYRENGGDFTSWVKSSRKKTGSKFSREVEAYIRWCIDNIFLQKNKPTIESVIDTIYRKAPTELRNRLPSNSTIRRRIDELDMETVILRRQGKAAHKEYLRGNGEKIKALHVMDRVEMDAMHLILGVVDDNGRFLGYVTIYFAIEFVSRCVVGWHVEVKEKMRGETTSGVINCFRNMLDVTLPEGVRQKHPVGGLAQCVYLDHGTAYANKSVKRFCKNLGISMQYTGTKNGWGKPVAEGFVKSFRNYFGRDIKGYRDKRDVRKGDLEHAKFEGCVKLSELKNAIEHFIHFEYHQKRHGGIKKEKPADIWDRAYGKLPPALADEIDMQVFMTESESRKLHQVRGITLKKQIFQSKKLKQMFCELDTFRNNTKSIPVNILYNPDDASAIVVIHPETGECITVRNIELEAVGLSFVEANAQLNANKQAEKDERNAEYHNPRTKAVDQLSNTPVKKRGTKRTHTSVPLDDGDIPFSMSEIMGHADLENTEPTESSLSDYGNKDEVWEVE
jgi:curved DNA-binding protein CbpA